MTLPAKSGWCEWISYGLISSRNSPAAIAAIAFWCEASANASWSSRDTFHSSATFSAVMPMPYAMATWSSANTLGDIATLLPIIGTIDIDSVPPASIRSALPRRI